MSVRTAGAVGAAVMFVPALATAQPSAQPQTITVTTTTTVVLAPGETVGDAPPGETAPVASITTTSTKAGIDRGFRLSIATGAAFGWKKPGELNAGFDLRIGFAIAPHLLLVGGVTAAAEAEDVGKLDDYNHAETASLEYWPTGRLWIEGGLGVGGLEHHHDLSGAMTAAVGYELFARTTYSIGAQLRAFGMPDDGDNIGAGLLVGASWY